MDESEARGELSRAVLRDLWGHHWWSFEQFLDAAAALTDEEFRRDLRISYNSVHGQLAHIIGAEQVWLKRVQLGESIGHVPGVEELPDIAAIEDAWQETKSGWQLVLEEDDLERVIHYRNTKGQEFSDPVRRVMTHLVDHGSTYRGVLISALRLLGRTPPATGVVMYTRIISGKFSL